MTLRALRHNLGLNQQPFWARVGITQSGGSRYESGTRRPPKPIRLLLALAYGKPQERARALAAIVYAPRGKNGR